MTLTAVLSGALTPCASPLMFTNQRGAPAELEPNGQNSRSISTYRQSGEGREVRGRAAFLSGSDQRGQRDVCGEERRNHQVMSGGGGGVCLCRHAFARRPR